MGQDGAEISDGQFRAESPVAVAHGCRRSRPAAASVPVTSPCMRLRQMARFLITLSALWAAAAVALGAFGAHALRDALPTWYAAEDVPRMEANWETAARYHLLHAIGALAAIALLQRPTSAPAGGQATEATDQPPQRSTAPASPWLWTPVYCLLIGSLIFSGCLYAMVLGGPRWLGAVVPIGGSLLILGWVALAILVPRPSTRRH